MIEKRLGCGQVEELRMNLSSLKAVVALPSRIFISLLPHCPTAEAVADANKAIEKNP
ncbi:hypothetical protein RND71_024440 [Anisodus tanguticus]|uniref:Uncharacterized protein n=1 Tax=Anisodus tanguticus TaxID=243964 RepID=A0AAE1RN60_9SOLA|nr:hypothetical protein RND71_024440 [Anisodus tanguticus]